MFFSMYIIPIILIGLLVYYTVQERSAVKKPDFFLGFESKEDALSQFMLLLATAFFGVFLFVLSKRVGSDLFDWKAAILLTMIFSTIIAHYYKAIVPLIFAIPEFFAWWGFLSAEWVEKYGVKPIAVLSVFALVFAYLYLEGLIHEALSEKYKFFKKFSLVYMIFGMVSSLGMIFFLSTEAGMRGIQEMSAGKSIFASWQLSFALIFFAAAIIAAIAYLALKDKSRAIMHELAGAGILAILFGIMPFLPKQDLFFTKHSYYNPGGLGILSRIAPFGIFWLILLNLLALALCLGVIFIGYLRKENWIINLGALSLGILILVKYFDWFYNSMDRSVFFLIGGVLLFIIGWGMDRSRKLKVKS